MPSLRASSGVRLRKVGGIETPPLTSAHTAAAACSGATDRPWPKAMVTVLSSPQRLGTSGSALSGSSVRMRSSWPIFLRNALWPSTPIASAMRAVPMLEEWMNTSGVDRTRFVGWKSWIWKRP